MNNLMSRKKKYRFQVELRVEELQHVPFLCQELYVKVRLLNGGFTNQSQSLRVENHVVRWDESFKFCSKMTANASTGELDSCICRVSVRQEMRGGKSFQKLGYADVNLAQFAGSGGSNIYLLEGYDSKHRLHNSTLKVTVDMTLLSGDPCFKAQPLPRPPQPAIIEGPTVDVTSSPSHQVRPPPTGSAGSLPSLGYNSLDKKSKASEEQELQLAEQTGHSRNSSNTSGSGYVSNASHSDKSGHARDWAILSSALHSQKKVSLKMKSFLEAAQRVKKQDQFSIHSVHHDHSFSLQRTVCLNGTTYLDTFPSHPPTTLITSTCTQCQQRGLICTAYHNSLNVQLSAAIITRNSSSKSLTLIQNGRDAASMDSLSLASSLSRSGSQGSGGTYSEGGSLERTVVNSGRGKSAIPSDNNKDPRVVSTREDAHDMIDQIFQDNIGTIRPDDSAETSGLQLYIREDGTASVSGHCIRPNGELKPIIINNR